MVAISSRLDVKRPTMLGYLTLFMLVLGIGAWGALANISGAVVSGGVVEVEGNRQILQHPTGGVIAAINAKDGDVVTAGQILVQLDGSTLYPELATVEGQWFEILARKNRLTAERDGLPSIVFHPELMSRKATSETIRELIAAQDLQFASRMKLLGEEDELLLKQIAQINQQIAGLEAFAAATDTQLQLVGVQVDAQMRLKAQGLTQNDRLLEPQRALAELQGSAGQVAATISESRGKIAELEIQRVRLRSEARGKAIAELRELEFQEIELRAKRTQLIDEIARLELRAPSSGIVYGRTVDTPGGVIQAGQAVLYVVPKDAALVVNVKIETIDIDQVHTGQPATLRFSGFDHRRTPEVSGHVVSVSADAYHDERTGLSYFEAEVALDTGERERLGQTLIPGMPVEAFIKTEERTALSYVVKPMSDYVSRAFRAG